MNRIQRNRKTLGQKMMLAMPASFLLALFTLNHALAGSVEGSAIAKGAKKLITDLTNWLVVLAPIVGGVLIIYCCIRRAAADETETKKWNNRITVIIVSTIGAVVGAATLNLILGYFK